MSKKTKKTAEIVEATKKTRGTEIKIVQFINDAQVAEITVNGKAALWRAQGEFFNGHTDNLDNCRMESWINGKLFQNRQGKLVAGKVTSFLIKAEETKAEEPTAEQTEFTVDDADMNVDAIVNG